MKEGGHVRKIKTNLGRDKQEVTRHIPSVNHPTQAVDLAHFESFLLSCRPCEKTECI